MYRQWRTNDWRQLLMIVLVLAACQQLGAASLIKAKAWLAPVLIERAWLDSLGRGGVPVKPWPWADTWPVARLQVPDRGVHRMVLAGDSGNALAFGPGHAMASAPLGSPGLAVIGGHRDTHFSFLRSVSPGRRMQLQLPDGTWREYQVAGVDIVDAGKASIARDTGVETLLLVTCYPFDALQANGPLRYVVTALPVPLAGASPNAAQSVSPAA